MQSSATSSASGMDNRLPHLVVYCGATTISHRCLYVSLHLRFSIAFDPDILKPSAEVEIATLVSLRDRPEIKRKITA
jgi:hypothetical protein